MDLAPCPTCGKPSLAQLTEHICWLCEDTYRYCPDHAPSEVPQSAQ